MVRIKLEKKITNPSVHFPSKNSIPVEDLVDQHRCGCHLTIEETQKKSLLAVLWALGLERI